MLTDFQTVSIEKVKNFWDNRPCNIKHSPKPLGSKEYFDEVEARKYFVEPHIPRFAEFEKWHGKKVLEIGCGIGTDTINFARAGALVTAIDLSPRSVEIARQRAKVYGLEDKIEFFCGDAEELSEIIPPQPYDLIYSFGVIHHTPNPEKVIEQMRFFSNSNTVIKVMLYHRYSYKVLWILINYGYGRFWRLKELISKYSEAQTGCPVTYTFTPKEVKELFAHHGFKVINIQVEHIFPYKISDYVNYKYNKVWHFKYLPQPVFRWLEKHFGWHLLIEAKKISES